MIRRGTGGKVKRTSNKWRQTVPKLSKVGVRELHIPDRSVHRLLYKVVFNFFPLPAVCECVCLSVCLYYAAITEYQIALLSQQNKFI